MLRFAVANLLSRPGRTLLATIGLTIAIAGMVGLFAIAGGIDHMLEASLGPVPGVVVMQAGAPIPLFSTLPSGWGREMADIEGVNVVNPEVWTRVNLLDGESVLSPPRLLLGADIPNRLRLKHGVYTTCVEDGRFLSKQDRGQPHVVISRQIAEDLDKQVGDPLDVNGREMTVVGIYHTGSLLADVTIIADIDVVRDMIRVDTNTVSCFYLEPHDGVTSDVLVERVQQQFAGREPPEWRPSGFATTIAKPPTSVGDWVRLLAGVLSQGPPRSSTDPTSTEEAAHTRVQPSDRNDTIANDDADSETPRSNSPKKQVMEVHSVADWGDRFSDLATDLNLVLAMLTGLGMLIAVSSILNTMLMSVTERTVEFGILRANGWSQGDVVRLITCESALLGLAGGLLGVSCGWIATQVINHLWADRILLYAGPVLLVGSLTFSICVGVLGGLYPSLRAARMSPMQAIRRG